MDCVSDRDVWNSCPNNWLWVNDKLIIALKQGIAAAPAGVSVPKEDYYVVRPITNIRMMGRGARRVFLTPKDDELVPDGFFWSEMLEGPHVSVDYHWGRQHLAVEGFRNDHNRLDRFSRWRKVELDCPLPAMLHDLKYYQEWINVEYIGKKIIEVHLRYNDDFRNHDCDEIIPVWKEDKFICPEGYGWYPSLAGDRLGFWTKYK